LYTGATYSFLGALFAILTVDCSVAYLQNYFQSIAQLYHYTGSLSLINFSQGLQIIGLALVLGWSSAWVFVKHYLNAIEPV
jgi:cell division protein FtsX